MRTTKRVICDLHLGPLKFLSAHHKGRAMAQAVSRWLPTPAAPGRTPGESCGICGGQSGAEAGFLRVLRYPLANFIPPISPQSPSPIIRSWYNRHVVAAVAIDSVSPPLGIKKKSAH
jgi:hypothetical protein